MKILAGCMPSSYKLDVCYHCFGHTSGHSKHTPDLERNLFTVGRILYPGTCFVDFFMRDRGENMLPRDNLWRRVNGLCSFY